MQGPSTLLSLSSSTQHLDAYSDSLKQLSYRSPAWATGATGFSCYGSGEAEAIERGREGTDHNSDSINVPLQQERQRKADAQGSQATDWGLWHEDNGVGGADDEPGEASELGVQPAYRCVTATPTPIYGHT